MIEKICDLTFFSICPWLFRTFLKVRHYVRLFLISVRRSGSPVSSAVGLAGLVVRSADHYSDRLAAFGHQSQDLPMEENSVITRILSERNLDLSTIKPQINSISSGYSTLKNYFRNYLLNATELDYKYKLKVNPEEKVDDSCLIPWPLWSKAERRKFSRADK